MNIKILSLKRIIIFILSIYFMYWLLFKPLPDRTIPDNGPIASLDETEDYNLEDEISKENIDLNLEYSKCTDSREAFNGGCLNSNCIKSNVDQVAYDLFKDSILEEYQLSERYFDKHFDTIGLDVRDNGPESSDYWVEINYVYKIRWVKVRLMTVGFVLPKSNIDRRKIINELRNSPLWNFKLKNEDIISLKDLDKLIKQEPKVAYDFCQIHFGSADWKHDSKYNPPLLISGQQYRKASPGKNTFDDCELVYSEINLITGGKKDGTTVCYVE